MMPLQTSARQGLHLTDEQCPHHHRTATIVDFISILKKAAKEY